MQKNNSPEAIERILRNDPTACARFLGPDTRDLATILQADAAVVQQRGLTNARIAESLQSLRQAAWSGQGDPVSIAPHFEAFADAARGTLSCPFGDADDLAKVNTTVRNLERGTEITFSDLHIHLIAAHGFYEGRGAQFRLEPEQAINTLEIGESG